MKWFTISKILEDRLENIDGEEVTTNTILQNFY